MGLGVSLILIAAGAILARAVHVPTKGVVELGGPRYFTESRPRRRMIEE